MKPKTMILMVVAIVCGLGASYMTSRLLAERDSQPQETEKAPEPEKVKILVAKANLDHGASIKSPNDMFVEKTFLKDDAPKDGLLDTKVLKGKFLKRGLRKGDHVSLDDLMDERTSILARLPDGYQAYGIQVDPQSSASGWACQPGAKVNILWTMKAGDNKQSFASILLEDVLVLAADIHTQSPEGKAMPASIVTVALTTKDTLRVKMAQSYGPLSLTLRKFGDHTEPETMKYTGDKLFTASDESKHSKQKNTGTAGNQNGGGNDVDPLGNLPDLKRPNNIGNDKKDSTPPPAPKRYYHVVTFRQGEKSWRQVIEVDVEGNPLQDDVHGEQLTPPPALDGAPPQQLPQTGNAGKN
jgi:Flp pilus assembly protein CpaB